MSFKVKFYSDPGHGWGAVKRQKLYELCIADKISPYSYQKGGTVYLEEDCDLPRLVTALALKGITITYIEKHNSKKSPVRSYESFSV